MGALSSIKPLLMLLALFLLRTSSGEAFKLGVEHIASKKSRLFVYLAIITGSFATITLVSGDSVDDTSEIEKQI